MTVKTIARITLLAAFPAMSVAFADESIEANGGVVLFEGATSATTLPDGDVVLVFSEPGAEGRFTLPKNAKARILLVGGGGAGGSVGVGVATGAGGGGGAGGVVERDAILSGGEYQVVVGSGGMRVQTVVQSWAGDDGENSALSIGGVNVAAAKGGGGGGSVKINGAGTPGGSGGGGSWYGEFLSGGSATDGQGWAGGTPNDTNIGGGGGGGAKTSAGHGGTNGVAGAGRVSDITGVATVYAQGGRGGNRTDAAYTPLDGSGPGFGGDGAATGYAGKGADGIVIVRIRRLFDYTLVDYPAYTDSFFWTNGLDCVALDLSSLTDDQRAAIAWIDGTTNVVCSVSDGGAVTNGIGLHSFTIRLNDEYRWNDGNGGSDSPYLCFWRVKDPDMVDAASVEVTKTVSWHDGTNATISIVVHSTPERRNCTPNVLMLGGLCNAHGLTADVVEAAINAVTAVGNIDYFFFNNVTSTSGVSPTFQGSLLQGEAFSGTVPLKTSNHSPMYGFYEYLARAIDSGKAYDYVIFSFDRTLVASLFPNTHPREAEVVAFLRPLYDRNAVIWLVDNEPPDDTGDGITQTPWFPSQLVSISRQNYPHIWSSLYYYEYIAGANKGNRANSVTASYRGLNGLMGLFSPADYPVSRTVYDSNYSSSSSGIDPAKVYAMAGSANVNQVVYNDAVRVADLVSRVVRPSSATVALADTVNVTPGGLMICGARAEWTTNEATMGWVEMTPNELTITDTGVLFALSNVWTEAWVNLDIDVTDLGCFLSSVGATYNERTGEWEKDPNNGPVSVVMSPESGDEIIAEDNAATAVAWFFEAFRITGEVVHGEGEFVINGFVTNLVSVGEGSTPEVVFRGAPGWVLDYLEVDGEVKPVDHTAFNWFFENIAADHDIKVGFRDILVEPYPETGPYEHLCDGGAYGCELLSDPSFLDGMQFEWRPVYSMESNGVFTADGGQADVVRDANGNVVSTNVYVRILIMQPGYEEGVVLDRWTGVDEVTILPRALEITLDNQIQTNPARIPTSEFSYYPIVDSLMAGDHVEVTYSVNYPNEGGSAPITAASVRVLDADGRDVTGNYDITVNPGMYFYPEAEDCAAEAVGVVKFYDAEASGIAVTVLNPTSTPSAAEIKAETGYYSVTSVTPNGPTVVYSIDGGQTYQATLPTFTDVGEYTVHYKVSYSYTYRYQRSRWSWTQTALVAFDDFVSSAKVVIKPRTVVVTACSAEKLYDGSPLVEPAHSVSVRDDANGVGFVDGEGFASLVMTATSTITNPGTAANVPDAANAVFKAGTRLSNYSITYVNGELAVMRNQLSASASSFEKTYDGEPADQIETIVLDSQGNSLPSGSYTIRYATTPWSSTWSETIPEPPTDAGEYPVFFTVDGGEGYGTASGYAIITVKPRRVTLQAGSATQDYTGEPLTSAAFTVLPGEGDDYGFVSGEGVASVVMSDDSTITKPGTTANRIDIARIAEWTFIPGTKPQNYVFSTEDGVLTVNWRRTIEVVGPGVLSWEDVINAAGTGEGEAFFTMTVDGGEPMRIRVGDTGGWDAETLVFGGETNISHTIVIEFENTSGRPAEADVRNVAWMPYETHVTPALKDDPEHSDYTVSNLGTVPTNETSGVTLFNGDALVTIGEVDAHGGQTGDVVNPPGGATETTVGTEDYWYLLPDPRGGANTVAGTAPTLSPGETAVLAFTVHGDGEFRWESILGGDNGTGTPAVAAIVVDGATNQVYMAETNWNYHVIHVTDTQGGDGGAHVIEIIFTNDMTDGGSSMFVDDVTWTPSATADEAYGIVINTEPPSPNVEEIKKTIAISNDAASGWMPVYSNGTVVALRSADGTECGGGLDSTLVLEAVGTGEITIGRITIPERDGAADVDGGRLVVTVDGVEYVIPPIPDETVSYSIVTTNGVTTIENLVIKVFGDSDDVHTVTINYTRDADEQAGNTAAVIEDIRWKTYGQTDDGGSSWLDDEGVALMIIDHDDPGDGWVFLAFKPQLKVEEELVAWVTRSAKNSKIKVKFGRTRAECDACAPVIAQLSDKPGHEVRPVKVWVKVPLNGIVRPVGYWRIWIEESAIDYVDDDSPPVMRAAKGASDEVAAPTPDSGARSVNVFGIVKVESQMTNTIIAVPWTWYSAEERKATHIPAAKLVKTTNLSEGDLLMQYRRDEEQGDRYECWTVEDGEWTALPTATSNAVYQAVTGPDGAVSVRGYGLWLVRHRPVDASGAAVPFYLYGQSVTNTVVSTAKGGRITDPSYTMLGNPYCEPVRINSLMFRGVIGTEDRIIVPSGANASKYLQHKAGKGWRWVEVKMVNGAPKNTYDYNVTVPAGTGFWYVRRTDGDLDIEWPLPE